jgi:hypothetical protein
MRKRNAHVGSDFDGFLAEDDLLEAATTAAIKRIDSARRGSATCARHDSIARTHAMQTMSTQLDGHAVDGDGCCIAPVIRDRSKPLTSVSSAKVVTHIAAARSSLAAASFLLCDAGDREAPALDAVEAEIARIDALLDKWQPARLL